MRRVIVLMSFVLAALPPFTARAATFGQVVDVPIPGGVQPYGVAAGDLDGDGLTDMVASVVGVNEILLYRGNGDGTFTAPTAIATFRPAQEVVLLDFDVDGDLDIGASWTASGAFGLMALRGNGTGGFTSVGSPVLSAGSGDSDIAAGDINGDGRPDLAVTNPSQAQACHGFVGSLSVVTGCQSLSGLPLDIALSRVDGDALADAAVLYGSSIEMRKGSTSGLLGGFPLMSVAAAASVALADMTGDGAADIVTGSTVVFGQFTARYHAGNGSLSGFAGPTTIGAGSASAGGGEVFVTDLSGDGKNDLVMTNPGTTSVVYAQKSNIGNFYTVSTLVARPGPLKIAAAPVDDGVSVDLFVSGSASATVSLFLQANAPSPPQTPVAAGGLNELRLTWSAPASDGGVAVTSYRVYAGSSPGALSPLIGVSAGTTSYTETGLASGVTRYYAVTALNSVGESPRSEVVSATTFSPPSEPTDVVAQPGSAFGEVVISWGAPTDAGGDVPFYQICKGTAPGQHPFCADVRTATSFSDGGNGALATYHYIVRASNLAGTGPDSAEVCSRPFPWHTALGC